MSVPAQVLMPVPFASQGDKNTIPVTPSTETGQTNYASYQKGFPPVTMTPLAAGGLPPQGMDMNGILFALSSSLGFFQSGGLPTFNADFASTIGGYPLGAVLQSNDCASAYVSTIANNTTDFNESPESIGTSWLPWAGDAAKGSSLYIAVGEGTSDAITATFDPAITELTNGLVVFVRALASNATTTPTFSPDGLTATTITKGTYQPLAIGDIAGNGYWMILQYDSTQGKWVLQNPATGINIVIPSTMPVGAIYVQFAGQSDPTTLFGGTWENVSSIYAGLFFRAEGGNAAAFGLSQGGGAPNIVGFMGNVQMANWASTGAFYPNGTDGNEYNWNEFKAGGSGQRGINMYFSAANSNGTYSANEFRSANSTIRIWKRTA